jgi:L-ascorbate metabolism protein UlaG (beta-lactamase superfamily)
MDKWDILKDTIDIAIVPIGAYNPWKKHHCNPEEALMMADRINAKYFIPIHCNTFDQGEEPREEPLNWLNSSVNKYKIKVGLDNIGKTFTLSDNA